MKKTFFCVAAVCAGALMAGCGGSKSAVQLTDLRGEWNIIEVNGEKLGAGETPYIGLDAENRVYGNAGCNRMTGGFEQDSVHPGKIQFTGVATTRMMCPDMDTETKVLGALSQVAGYAEVEKGLSLTDGEGNAVLLLEKRETPALTLNDLEGEWIVSAVDGAALADREKTPFLAFDIKESRVHGNAGCNIINGGFSQEEGKVTSIRFSQMLSTMMACPDMDTERQILAALDKVREFGRNQDKSVALLDENGTEVLTLVKNTGDKLSR